MHNSEEKNLIIIFGGTHKNHISDERKLNKTLIANTTNTIAGSQSQNVDAINLNYHTRNSDKFYVFFFPLKYVAALAILGITLRDGIRIYWSST